MTLEQKVDRLYEIKQELERVTEALEAEKKQLEVEVKSELQTLFNGQTVYAQGTTISYYLYERTTETLDKKALSNDGVDLSKYTKTSKSMVLSHATNEKIKEIAEEK